MATITTHHNLILNPQSATVNPERPALTQIIRAHRLNFGPAAATMNCWELPIHGSHARGGKLAIRSDTQAIDVLLALTTRMEGKLPLDEALHAVTDAAMELFAADHASVRILDESGDGLLSGARSGQGLDSRPMSFSRGEGLAGWVVDQGEPLLLADTEQDERFMAGGAFTIRSFLGIPLGVGGQVLGLLGLTAAKPEAFSAADRTLAQLLANSALPAILAARHDRLDVTDPVTKTFQEAYLLNCLEEEIRQAGRYVVPLGTCMFTIDAFGDLVEHQGEAAGERVLKHVAEQIRGGAVRGDILVRRGGSSFLLIMPYTNGGQSFGRADKIRETVAGASVEVSENVSVTPTLSGGVAAWSGRESAQELKTRADIAARRAAQAGGNAIEIARFTLEVGDTLPTE